MPARASGGPRVLSLRELNRATLARQLLLRRARLDVTDAVERLTPLQAQWSPSPYLALWARLSRFRIADLESALETRDVLKATLMRGTLHLVTRREYPMYAALITRAREALWRSYLERAGVDLARIRPRLLAYAAEPRTRAELTEHVEKITRVDWTKHKYGARPVLLAAGGLVHPARSARWGSFRSAGLIAAEKWIGAHALPPEREAYAAIVRRYLAAFGPASLADVGSWGGIRVAGPLRQAVEDLAAELVELRDDKGRVLHDLRRAPRPGADAEAPVRFLPKWDQLLLAYAPAERVRVLPERYRRAVIAVNGDVSPTVLVDGTVAARWDARVVSGTAVVRVDPLGRLSKADRTAIAEEGERLARFVHPDAKASGVRFGDVAAYNLGIRP
ncbi:MAG TPA: winged helix DNA-binding domain-containing protein [Candidatus Limnocylindria bacterium]|nr:winged helix DNA-binding domain-containing protein [Candidatus Limnocylindria bacterium]